MIRMSVKAGQAQRRRGAGITWRPSASRWLFGYAKTAGMAVVTGLYTLLFPMAVIATRARTGRHRRVIRGPAR
jgi:hypothetical protein